MRDWIERKIEQNTDSPVSKEVYNSLLHTILESQAFSDFSMRKFSTLKRFGADGLDSGIVAVQELVNHFHEMGGKELVLGMAHRGRLNTLSTVFKKPYTKMFMEFLDQPLDFLEETVYNFYGDVKYHNGYTTVDKHTNGNEMRIQMLPNPSHLEAINPLVMGYAKGKKDKLNDENGAQVLPVLIHGDAALAGQGIIYETLQMEKLRGYSVGGTIHIVFNNQVGFTTEPLDGRTTRHSSSIARSNENLMIMVNADDPVKVREAMRLGLEYRSEFQKDVFIELIGYRKNGHNETDNPRFTQPVMYQTIDAMKPMHQKYSEFLVSQGLFSQEEVEGVYNHYYNDVIDRDYNIVKNKEVDPSIYNLAKNDYSNIAGDQNTGMDLDKFKEIGRKLYSLDLPDFTIDNTVKRLYKTSLKSIEEGKGISWATAEHMAYASLLNEGYSVRLSGEDCERGTFSHRHAVLVDQKNNKKHFPLSDLLPQERKNDLTIVNSLLSEYGVLGFDYGYTWARQDALTIWEAQFGDFANGAQIIIDQFLMNSEKKWRRFSGLVMLLPHGYDGMGPEHSNARIERFLSNVDDDFMLARTSQEYRDNIESLTNIKVCNMTLASNFFHSLRNQVKNQERKPMVVMSPKKILMNRGVQSSIEEFAIDKGFQPVLPDSAPASKVKKVLICSGQIYFELNTRRTKLNLDEEIAIIRLERIGPFAYNEFKAAISGYGPETEFVFVSEEQFNFGAYLFVEPRANLILEEAGFKNRLKYVGRSFSSSSSTGIGWLHAKEIENILTTAVGELVE
jgi:2-oxoglutarate dehydrogenase E1 component